MGEVHYQNRLGLQPQARRAKAAALKDASQKRLTPTRYYPLCTIGVPLGITQVRCTPIRTLDHRWELHISMGGIHFDWTFDNFRLRTERLTVVVQGT